MREGVVVGGGWWVVGCEGARGLDGTRVSEMDAVAVKDSLVLLKIM